MEGLKACRGPFCVEVERLQVNSVVAVVGRNGAGKTTMLDAIAGVLRSRGRVEACGRDVSGLPPERRGLAYIQAVPIDPPGGPHRFLRAVARRHGTTDQLPRVLEAFGLTSLGRGLSTGQRQLVNLAAALLARPCAFLMDEPTSHLDWLNKRAFNDAVRRLGRPVLYVTHDPLEAYYVGDLVCLMEEGRIRRCTREKVEVGEVVEKIGRIYL